MSGTNRGSSYPCLRKSFDKRELELERSRVCRPDNRVVGVDQVVNFDQGPISFDAFEFDKSETRCIHRQILRSSDYTGRLL